MAIFRQEKIFRILVQNDAWQQCNVGLKSEIRLIFFLIAERVCRLAGMQLQKQCIVIEERYSLTIKQLCSQ